MLQAFGCIYNLKAGGDVGTPRVIKVTLSIRNDTFYVALGESSRQKEGLECRQEIFIIHPLQLTYGK